MAALADKLKHAAGLPSTISAKSRDLETDTVDLSSHSAPGLTTDAGLPIPDTDNWLRVAVSSDTGDGTVHPGPALLEDQIAREKIMRFDHERIPERVVHARGAGAHGYFQVHSSNPIASFTCARVLTDTSIRTPVFVRFSTVQGSRGSADTVRDVRGFATKFYTPEGNWDLVGNNIPVFFIQDAMKFPDFVHAVKPEPHNEVPTGQSAHNNFWDFFVLQPETSHMVMWAMSDRAIPRSYRMMQGFGVNTFTLISSSGERSFVKFHWIPELGVHSLVWDEALKIAGQDPDFHRKDLNEAITSGAPPKWTLGVQIIAEADEHKFEFDILDATKIWPENLVPVVEVGEMILDRVVDEYFPETEQVAFCTSHLVPGIGFSNDPLLQGRNFSYFDTQLSRLGVNWQELPINRPVCPYLNFNRDGQGRHRITRGQVNYWPNRFEQAPPAPLTESPSAQTFIEHPDRTHGLKSRFRGHKFAEHISQAQLFFNSLSTMERIHLVNAFAFELSHCDDPLVYERAIPRLMEIDTSLARTVAEKVAGGRYEHGNQDLDSLASGTKHPNHGNKTIRLSQMDYLPTVPTIKSRRVAILIADGFDASVVTAMKAVLNAAGAVPVVVGPRRNSVYAAGRDGSLGDGSSVHADHHFEGQRSTLFDAILIPSGQQSIDTLKRNGRAIHWVREAFGHLKAIGAVGEAVGFLRDVVVLPGVEFAGASSGGGVVASYGVVTTTKMDTPQFFEVGKAFEIVKEATDFMTKFSLEASMHRCWARELEGLTDMVAY